MVERAAEIAIALLVAAAACVAAWRKRRGDADARRDARLLDDLRAEIAGGRLPEARDRVRAARGPLARVLLAVLRFPYGVHARALELARRDGLAAERRPGRAAGRALPILSGLCATAGVAPLLVAGAAGALSGAAVRPAWLGFAGAGAILLLGRLDAGRARDASRRLGAESAEVARRIVAYSESLSAAEGALGEAADESAVEIGVSPPA